MKIDVQFLPSDTTSDLALVPGSVPDYRGTVYDITYIDCDGGTLPGDAGDGVLAGGGCAVGGGGGSSGAMAFAAVSLAGLLARRRRR